ncbi:hypothetical protein GQ473_05180 [archaeon]|nr:hypothetical protein [archaeon]
MHEFGAAKNVIDELLKTKPKKATIMLGQMISKKETFYEILKEHLIETELKDIKLDIIEVPVIAKCSCGFEGHIDIPTHVHFVRCPLCNNIAEVLNGDKIEIKDLIY